MADFSSYSPTQTDWEIVRRICQNACRFLPNAEDHALDFVQEILLTILRRAKGLRNDTNIKGWIATTAYLEAKKLKIRLYKRWKRESGDFDFAGSSSKASSVLDSVCEQEDLNEISRLEAEYKVEAVLEQSPFDTARWLKGSGAALKGFADFNKSNLAKDRDGDPVFMARSSWDVSYQQEKNPELVFSATKER